MRGEDSREVEEEDEIDLPLTVLTPVERGSEPTPSNVVTGVLNQLAPVEGAGDSREIEAVDCRPADLSPWGTKKLFPLICWNLRLRRPGRLDRAPLLSNK